LAHTILIVEKNELNMKLFNDVLQTNGYDTIQSVDSLNIIQLAREKKPDLVFIDVQFSEISSSGLIKTLKNSSDFLRVPIIALTANAMEKDEAILTGYGYDGYIAKPISVPVFLETVAKFLN